MERPLGSKYVLETALGRGATGEVWKGRAVADGTELAFKVLQDTLARDADTVRRFVQESSILVQLQHPNLVHVHDLVVEGQTLAIVMDLVVGRDLRASLHDFGTLPMAEACRIAADTAAGLAAVHAGGVVHRDIKPENVLLDQRQDPPAVRVTDFGIARIAQQSASTRSTMVVGTPQYMSPEVFDGKAPTPASDLYSLGIMLYEMCCGVTPFAGDSTMQILRKHSEELPGRPAGIPDPLWSVIWSMLAKNPADRPPSAQAVADYLGRLTYDLAGMPTLPALAEPPASVPLLHDQVTSKVELPRERTAPPTGPHPPEPAGPQSHAAPPRKNGRRALLATAVVLAVIAGGAGVWVTMNHSSNKPSPVSLARQPSTPPTSGSQQNPSNPSTNPTNGSSNGGIDNGTSPPPTGSPQASAPNPNGTTYLSELQPVQSSYVAGISNGPVQIGTTTYQASVRFTCNSVPTYATADVTYNVAGSKFLNMTLGVPNDATNGVGDTMAITFLKDSSTPLRSPINVSVGKPQTVRLDLQGASQLEITCRATDNSTHYTTSMDIAFGQATVGSQ